MGYFAPASLDDALSVLDRGDASIVAGGTDFFPGLAAGKRPRSILDPTGIEVLKGIARTPGGWRIGAAATWSDIVSEQLPACFDALKEAGREVGSIQIQNAGTIAGNICNASPAADGVPPLLALNAEVEIASAAGTRRVALGDFITGVRAVDLRPGELGLRDSCSFGRFQRGEFVPQAGKPALPRDLDRHGGGCGSDRKGRDH